MTIREIDDALAAIVFQKCAECEEKLKALPKSAKTERKALQIHLGMYSLFNRAGILYYFKSRDQHLTEKRYHILTRIVPDYPKLYAHYLEQSENEKVSFLLLFHAELYMRHYFLKPNTEELAQAEKSGDVENTFELRLKVNALKDMLHLWEEWRKENNIYPGMFEEV